MQEGIDPSMEVIFVGSLPVDVPPESHEVCYDHSGCIKPPSFLNRAQVRLCAVVLAHCA